MPDMPDHIAKGTILKRIDELSRDRPRLQQLHDALDVPNPKLSAIALQFRLVSPSEQAHLLKDWFDSDSDRRWWENAQPVEPIVAAGFKLAIQQALDRNLPLDCYWVCYGEREMRCCRDQVEFNCCVSDQQVTVIIQTPAPELLSITRPAMTETDPIFVVKREDRNSPITTTQPRYAATPDFAAVPVQG
jgi:hypothetical protein